MPIPLKSHPWLAAAAAGVTLLVTIGMAAPVRGDLATPTLTITAIPSSATVGDTLRATVTMAGGDAPSGSVGVALVSPGGAVLFAAGVPIQGDGTYSAPNGRVADSAGTWRWTADYGGDTRNNSVSAERLVTVSPASGGKAHPTLTVTPNPRSAVTGTSIRAAATLAGGSSPQGTVTFVLYDPNHAAAYTETVGVAGNGTYQTSGSYRTAAVGAYEWVASYSGDANNLPASSAPASAPVIITSTAMATPALTITANPKAAAVGVTLKATATLSSGDNPSGLIIFELYNPSGNLASYQKVTVQGNGSYTAQAWNPADAAGTWQWRASYGGDSRNWSVTASPSNVTVTATATASPTPTPATSSSPPAVATPTGLPTPPASVAPSNAAAVVPLNGAVGTIVVFVLAGLAMVAFVVVIALRRRRV